MVTAGEDDDTVHAGDGDDQLHGDARFPFDPFTDVGSGNDRLFGENGNDLLRGGAGGDDCDGGPETDLALQCEVVSNVP